MTLGVAISFLLRVTQAPVDCFTDKTTSQPDFQ